MGATSIHAPKGYTIRAAVREDLRDGYEIVADTSRRTGESGTYGWPLVYIAAVRKPDGETFALVVSYRRDNRSHWNLTYRLDDETVGPTFAEFCTSAILDALTPTTSEWANKWREQARAAIAAEAAKPKAPKVAPGDTIRLSSPLRFMDGRERDTFTLIERATFRSDDGARVKLPVSWRKTYQFELVSR